MRAYRKLFAALAAFMLCAALPCANAAEAPAPAAFIYIESPFQSYQPYGLMDTGGQVLQPARFNIARTLGNGFFFMGDSGLGYEWMERRLALFDPRGNRLTNFDYYDISMLGETMFVCKMQSDTHIIGLDGEVLYKAGFPAYVSLTSSGYAVSEENYDKLERLFMLLSKDFEITFEGAYSSAFVTNENMIVFKKHEFYGIMSLEGEIIVEPTKYRTILDMPNEQFLFGLGDGNYGLLSKNGDELVPAIYGNISYFEGGIFAASMGEKLILLDESGRELHTETDYWISPVYNGEEDAPLLFTKRGGSGWYLLWPDGRKYEGGKLFNYHYIKGTSLILVLDNGLWGEGNGIIRFQDIETGEYENVSGRYAGIINNNIVEVNGYDEDGNWRVTLHDFKGRPLGDGDVLAQAFDADWEEGGLIIAGKPGKLPHKSLYGIMNEDGEWLIPCRYNLLRYVAPGVYSARAGSRVGYINSSGEWIYSTTAYSLLDD